ncbi:glycosyl hydrolase family 76-domain-containing protein [Xylogone sp. PMI_703]|nr:glycosyl hydrolase family 76-domain-containing protein [Xylogone sp. PMI_703]
MSIADLLSVDSIKSVASQIAYGMMTYYKGNESGQIPGLLPGPYYWWEAGAMFGALVDYWHYTGDTTYVDVTMQALQFQVGPYNDYMPPNESASLGNDDQAFWGMAALAAAEYNFPNPPPKAPSWLALAQAVFNDQIARWDTQYCGGGIRWQIYQINGYDLKNSISNGCLFNIASRLARYTGDPMYAKWAVKIWDWMNAIGLMDKEYNVYDNAEATQLNCTKVDHNQWVYNAGTMMIGAATMYNYTNGSALWKERTTGIVNRTAALYFPKGIMQDICESTNQCNVDEHSFKAYLSRWMAATAMMAPYTFDTILPLLRSSAIAAAAQCTGTGNGAPPEQPPGTVCGLKWYLNGTWDGSAGVGQQMAALETVIGTLIHFPKYIKPPVTTTTGGTSQGNPHAGHNTSAVFVIEIPPAKTRDKIGAGFLTAIVLGILIWTMWFMWSKAWEGGSTINGRMNPNEKQART